MNQASDNAVLRVENLDKSFRGKPALAGVSFAVQEASLTVILGSAGAGKTTTLRIIAGLETPGGGRVELAGRDVAGYEPKDRNVAMIFDNLALYPDKTGFENIASPLVVRKLPKDEVKRRVEEMGVLLKVSHILDRLPKTMSGGERQRIALGRALVRTPSLYLLDEPLSSLDAMLRIELRAELKRLQRECGCSFLLATPDYNEAMAIADSVVMLREGRVAQIAPPQTLYDQPSDRETARFVGAPQINLVPAECALGPQGLLLRAAGATLPLPAHLTRACGREGFAFELGVRPENLQPASPDLAALTAGLVDIEPLGLKSVLTVRNKDTEMRMLVDSAQAVGLAEGQTLGVEFTSRNKLLAFDPETGQRISD